MFRPIGCLCVVGLLLSVSCTTLEAQNLVQNGSFETGSFVNSGDGFMAMAVGSTVIDNWTSISSDMSWGTVPNNYNLTASDGSFLLDLTGYDNASPYGGVTQTITTEVGRTYALSLDLGTQESDSQFNGPISVSVSAASTTQSFTHNPGGVGNQWRTYSFDFTASATTTEIDIVGTSGNLYIGVDNVRVTAVPAPSALAAFLIGAVPGVGLILRRRRK